MTSNWNEYLAQIGARLEEHRVDFAHTAEHAKVCMTPLLHLGMIRCIGEDAPEFLHNLLSNDVKALAPEQVQWNSFNSPKGRMLASLLVYREAEGFSLVLSADLVPALHRKLSMYVLRSKVDVKIAQDIAMIGVFGNTACEALSEAQQPIAEADMSQHRSSTGVNIRINKSLHLVVESAAHAPETWARLQQAGVAAAGTDAWQLAMVRAGIPLITAATQEAFVAQMLNYELIGGVSFNKGCYPGQEIIARTQYLGKLKKRMYRVRGDEPEPPAPGDDVYTPGLGSQSAGKIVNVAPTKDGFEALVVMQTRCADNGEVHLHGPDGPKVALCELPYSLPEHDA